MNNTHLNALLATLAVPPQDLAILSFCNSTKPNQVEEWLQTLPLTQVQQISVIFYSVLPEISRLKTTAENRLALVEALRIPVDQCLQGLSRGYLNQPLILPDAAIKTATIAQAIQKQILNAYLVATRELCAMPKKELEACQAQAIHRALTSLGLLLLRSYQLYLPVPDIVWSEVHALYQIAVVLGVTQVAVADPLPHHQNLTCIYRVYLRILLLASAQPNQLRQDEVAATYHALNDLAQFAELEKYTHEGHENLFVVNTKSYHPPSYKSHFQSAVDNHLHKQAGAKIDQLLELRTDRLVSQLREYQPPGEVTGQGASWHKGLHLSASLIQHLFRAWSHLALRNSDRHDATTGVELTIGLTNIHYYLANQQPFNLFLNQGPLLDTFPDDPFSQRGARSRSFNQHENDPWSAIFDIKGTLFDGDQISTANIEKRIEAQVKPEYLGQHLIYNVPLIDRSTNGYGLEWRNEIPVQLKAGELLGLREYGRDTWTIGVVRWAHQIKGATQLGIQVIASRAVPAAIAMVSKTGTTSEYLRALLIPEIQASQQPASLITNSVSFRERDKARLYRQPEQGAAQTGDCAIQLTQQIFATGALSQFNFREIAFTMQPVEKHNVHPRT